MTYYMRERRTARATGTGVALYDTSHPSNVFDPSGGRWVTICEHGRLCNHRTLTLARHHMAAPDGWCDECAKQEAHRPRSKRTLRLTVPQVEHLLSVAVAALAGPFGEGDTEGLDYDTMQAAADALRTVLDQGA